jgi:hypothetical protein
VNVDGVCEYLVTLERLESEGSQLPIEGEEERAALEGFKAALSDFKAPDFRDRLARVYASRLFFNDTLKTMRSGSDLVDYLCGSADALESGRVEFLDVSSSRGNHYLRWRMRLRFERIAGGSELDSVGMSHIRFDRDGKVVLHQDFWDAAGGLFEHLPAIGWAIRGVRKRLL